MLSYHNDEETKNIYIKRMLEHMDSCDHRHLIGCALFNCIPISKQHSNELGIPEWLAETVKTITERMSEGKARTFSFIFLKTMEVGVNLDQINKPFLIYLVQSNIDTPPPIVPPTALDDRERHQAAVKSAKVARQKARLTAMHKSQELYLLIVRSAAKRRVWSTMLAWASRVGAAVVAKPPESEAVRKAAAEQDVAWAAVQTAHDKMMEVRTAAHSAWQKSWDVMRDKNGAKVRAAAYDRAADKLLQLLRECR